MLVAFAVNADPVVLPATLDVTNVSFRSDNLPDSIIADGGAYDGTYFDMGAHDSSNDTLLYVEWDVTIEPITYNIAVDVYNTNSWRVQLDILNQSDQVVKAIRYKGSSSQKGQFSIGSLDLSDLAAGNYKVRARSATAWSRLKLKDIIFVADYSGVSVDLPGTLEPAYAELSTNASITNGAIAFKPSTANQEYAIWNVSVAEACSFNVSIDYTSTNGHTYGVAIFSADGQTQIGSVAEDQSWDAGGVKKLGAIAVPAAGNYTVKLTNATQWSEALLNSITLIPVYTVAGVEALCGVEWANNAAQNDMTYSEGAFRWTSGPVYYDGTSTWGFKVCKDHTWTAFPNDNYELKPDWKLTSGAGYYNVEIAYTTAPQAIEVTATYLYPKVEVAGTFNGWTLEELTYSPSGYLYKNIPVTAGDNEFKVIVNNVWQGNEGVMTRINCENWAFAPEVKNSGLKADIDGSYTFYYQNDLVSVSYPTSFTRVVNNTNYQTLCVPFDAVKPENVAIYEVTDVSASSVTIGVPDIAYLEAGHSYIIKPEVVADIIINMKDEGNAVAAPIDTHMFGVLGATKEPTAAEGIYILSENEFHLVAADNVVTISSTRAYVKNVDPNAAPALRIIGTATDIQNVQGEETYKFIQNGQLYIMKNGVVYDAMGATVK